MFGPRTFAVLLALLLLVIVVAQNSDAVVLRFLFWEGQVSLVLLIPCVALAGFGVGYVARGIRTGRRSGPEGPANGGRSADGSERKSSEHDPHGAGFQDRT